MSSDINAENRLGSAERRARAVAGSAPAARPMPRSIRPGCSADRVWKASATRNGLWLGSMIPPEPTRIRWVRAATCAMSTSGELLATAGRLWCSANHTRR